MSSVAPDDQESCYLVSDRQSHVVYPCLTGSHLLLYLNITIIIIIIIIIIIVINIIIIISIISISVSCWSSTIVGQWIVVRGLL